MTAQALLDSLRWRADQIITNHEGERVWLTAVEGGTTDCCLAVEPCGYHGRLAQPAPARNQ